MALLAQFTELTLLSQQLSELPLQTNLLGAYRIEGFEVVALLTVVRVLNCMPPRS